MWTVGFIGSGSIGRTLARLAVGAGHQVVLMVPGVGELPSRRR